MSVLSVKSVIHYPQPLAKKEGKTCPSQSGSVCARVVDGDAKSPTSPTSPTKTTAHELMCRRRESHEAVPVAG